MSVFKVSNQCINSTIIAFLIPGFVGLKNDDFKVCTRQRFYAIIIDCQPVKLKTGKHNGHMALDKQYSRTCVKLPLAKRPKIGFQDQLLLKAGQIAECYKGSILQYFRPSLSYHSSLRLCLV